MSGDLRVTGVRRTVCMYEQDLDDPEVDSALKKVSREAMPQAMGRHGLAQLRRASCDPTGLLQCGDADMIASLPAGKQPQAGTRAPPIGAQNIVQTRRQHRVAVLSAFAAFDMDQLSLAVDRGDLQAANLPDAEPGCVCRRQRNTVAQSHNGLQEARDLVGSQNGRQLFWLPPIDDPLERILLAHRDAIEESQRASRLIDVGPGALLGDQMT